MEHQCIFFFALFLNATKSVNCIICFNKLKFHSNSDWFSQFRNIIMPDICQGIIIFCVMGEFDYCLQRVLRNVQPRIQNSKYHPPPKFAYFGNAILRLCGILRGLCPRTSSGPCWRVKKNQWKYHCYYYYDNKAGPYCYGSSIVIWITHMSPLTTSQNQWYWFRTSSVYIVELKPRMRTFSKKDKMSSVMHGIQFGGCEAKNEKKCSSNIFYSSE